MSFSADRTRFVYSFQDFDTPPDLYTAEVDNFEPVRLTDTNPQIAELQLGGMQDFRWKSHDGMEIEGLLHLPVGYEEGKSYPLMLNIHGGPAGNFPNGWRSSYHWWAGLGYVAMSANVRGSSGYTDHLREGNTVARGDGIGFGDFQDLMTGVDSLIERGIVDPERMGVRGWSYGGILGGWTITHTDRFKAASIGAGVYDWTSEYGPGFNNDVRLWHIGGTPWDNPDGYRNQSALTHAKNVTSATLLIHGIEDRTDTEQQSMMFFTALKDIGAVPVRYMKFRASRTASASHATSAPATSKRSAGCRSTSSARSGRPGNVQPMRTWARTKTRRRPPSSSAVQRILSSDVAGQPTMMGVAR